MHAAVPRDVDEAYQFLVGVRAYIAEAPGEDSRRIRVTGSALGGEPQRTQRGIVRPLVNCISQAHGPKLRRTA